MLFTKIFFIFTDIIMLSFLDRQDGKGKKPIGNTKLERRFYEQENNLQFHEEEEEGDDLIDLSQQPDFDPEPGLEEIETMQRKLEAWRAKHQKSTNKRSRSPDLIPNSPTTPAAQQPPVKNIIPRRAPPVKRAKASTPATRLILDNEDDEEEEEMIDLTKAVAASTSPRLPKSFHLGGGYYMGVENMEYKGQEGFIASYEALKLEKVGEETSEKKKNPINILMPVKLIPNLLTALNTIETKLQEKMTLVNMTDLETFIKSQDSEEGTIDLSSSVASTVPNIKFKLDHQFLLRGETMDWGKTPYDVLSFVRLPKRTSDKKPGKPFALSLPGKYLHIFHLTLQYIAREKGFIYGR